MNENLDTDETREAVFSLEFVAEIAPSVVDDVYRWKWVIIALHNSVQAFMVMALRESTNVRVLTKKSAKKLSDSLHQFSQGGEFTWPEERLDQFLNLYDKTKGEAMTQNVFGRKFEAQDIHDKSMKMLNEVRNDFIHFVPKRWNLEVNGLPSVCLACLDVIHFLGWESHNVLWVDTGIIERAKMALTQARKTFESLREVNVCGGSEISSDAP